MEVKEVITKLLEMPMDAHVVLFVPDVETGGRISWDLCGIFTSHDAAHRGIACLDQLAADEVVLADFGL